MTCALAAEPDPAAEPGQAPILRLIDAYRAALDLPDSTVSHRVFSDSKRVRLLRNGGDITFRRYDRALRWLAANWPEGALWPDDIARPAPAPAPGPAPGPVLGAAP